MTYSCSTQYNLIPGVLQQRPSAARCKTVHTAGELTAAHWNKNSQMIRNVFTGSEQGS